MAQQQGYMATDLRWVSLLLKGLRAYVYQFQWRRLQKDPYAALASLCQKYRG